MENRRQQKNEKRYFDYSLVFIVLFLLAFGLIMIYSTSSYKANLDTGDSAFYLKKQMLASGLGLAAMVVVSNIPYQIWKRFAVLGYFGSILLILLIIPFGVERNGAKRWLYIGGMSLQPAEVAKLGMILALATLVCKLGTKVVDSRKGFVMMFIVPIPVCLLVWKVTSNMSSAVIIFGIAFLMLFVSTPGYKRFILLSLAGAALVGLAVLYIVNSSNSDVGGFRGARVLAWLDPEAYASGKGFQTLQALYAIGSGGIFGKGLGKSMQKLGFIPEAQNDMIFSIICEELGLLGAIAVILLFVILIWRMMIIANNARDLFGALLVVGVMGHISVQVILNIAVVTNTIPNTGVSLPFISYGGSSVMFLLVEIGIVMSVAKGIRLREY
ncbi:MAG: FtsW/RodA/SpoVE family cell cycle protein [Lachnospiraceae bacterium]|nr:FtsW/RodA/SpoVE family cell cycle protein [Lachnospiraceae bacterium]